MSEVSDALLELDRLTLKPKPALNLVEWADTYRKLSRESAAEPGRWRTNRVPYMAEPMSTISRDDCSEMVLMISSQLGKTELLLNLIGFYAHLEPSPILLIQPTEGAAASFSKERIAPMIRDTECISDLFKSDAYGDSTNTILHKGFVGGFIALAGSNSPTCLAGRPIRVILLDEIDRFPASAKTEGDPVDIVRRRSQNFHDSKFVAVSTPTVTGHSKIHTLYLDSDQRKYNIKCVHCSELFYPEWKHITWIEPEDAALVCPSCGGLHNDVERLTASKNGKWIATNPAHRTPGFHTNAIVSPWIKLTSLVYEFLACENEPAKLQPFHNTVLGLPFEISGEAVGSIEVQEHTYDFNKSNIPADVIILTVGADCQQSEIHYEVLGHTETGQTYSIDYKIIEGDTSDLATFELFKTSVLDSEYTRVDKIKLKVSITFIDSGYNTKIVYKFCEANKRNNIYAIKGFSGPRTMLVKSTSKFGAGFYKIAVDLYKELLFANLKIVDKTKDGFCYFPKDRQQSYFEELCESEIRTYTKDKNGTGFWAYRKKASSTRNEALDIRIYAMAAYDLVKKITIKNAEYSIKKQLKELNNPENEPIQEIEILETKPIFPEEPAVVEPPIIKKRRVVFSSINN
jgi:phage terminase large subunit GpA-like protein